MGLFRRSPKQAAAYSGSGGNPEFVVAQNKDLADEPWQTAIRGYDDVGPGFVGFALDVKALLSSMCQLIVEEQNPDGTWSPTENDEIAEIGRLYRGETESSSDLIYKQVRGVASVGEVYLETHNADDGTGAVWSIINGNQMRGERTGPEGIKMVIIQDRENQKAEEQREIPKSQIQRMWWPDPKWPGEAWSAMKRAIPDIERYLSLVRSQDGAAKSRLLNANLVWLASEAAQAYAGPPSPDSRNFHRDFSTHGSKALTRHSTLEEHIPFTLSTPHEYGPPQVVDFGRDITAEDLDAEEAAVRAVARAIDLPQRVLTTGAGEGNHWSDWLMQADTVRLSIKPGLRRSLHQLTKAQLLPLLGFFQAQGMPINDVNRFRYGADFSEITKHPDESTNAIQYYRAGIMSREAAGRRGMNLADDEFLDLNSEEADWFEMHFGRGNSREFGVPAAEVMGPSAVVPGQNESATNGRDPIAGAVSWPNED